MSQRELLADTAILDDGHVRLNGPDAFGQMLESARPIGRMISPLALTPCVRMQGRFIYAGFADRLVCPREQVTRLWQHWGEPEIHW